ncbi:class I SAM-dependent methyltransferase [bacterium]|nr:class I SAM-dependent methyltransferase [bacterium]
MNGKDKRRESTGDVRSFYDNFWTAHANDEQFENDLNRVRGDLLSDARERVRKYEEFGPLLVIGCGPGSELGRFSDARCKIVAVDISLEGLKRARKAFPNAFFVLADAHCLPFRDDAFGVSYQSLVLMHMRAAEQIKELLRVIKQAGAAIIVEPLKHHPVAILYRLLGSKFSQTSPNYLSMSQLNSVLSKCNKSKVTAYYFLTPFLLPLLFARLTRGILFFLLLPLRKLDLALMRTVPRAELVAWMALVEAKS